MDWAMYGFEGTVEHLYNLPVNMRLTFICVLTEPGILHLTKLLLCCTPNPAESIFLGMMFLVITLNPLKVMFLVQKCFNLVTIIIEPVLIFTGSIPKGFRCS